MQDVSILIGGRAGEGINLAGLSIARLLNQLGYHPYMYYDYPSLIRGGHNFAIVRGADRRISCHRDRVDYLLALNQDCIDLHRRRIKETTTIIYDSNAVKTLPKDGIGIDLFHMVKEENAPPITRNSGIIGAFSRAAGIPWKILEDLFRRTIPKSLEINLAMARRGYDASRSAAPLAIKNGAGLPMISGNEAIALGFLKSGLSAYIAYPMTPSTSLLTYLAAVADEFALKVVHPENEIAVMLMALGCSYMGERVAVGTSGGGFCLMTEGLSLAGQAELPIVIVMGQRTGPSTGLPTYTAQGDLFFVMHAGQGEFPRFIVAPGDADEAYFWGGVALNMAWKFQVPAFVLTDKHLAEGIYTFDSELVPQVNPEEPPLWDRQGPYNRYAITASGVSPLAFAPEKGQTIKVNSYFHDPGGITTENEEMVRRMQEKFLRKEESLAADLRTYEQVKVQGDQESATALLCWGSNSGVCREAAETLGIRMVQPVVLMPFPAEPFRRSVEGVERLIAVENNVTSQLSLLIRRFGFRTDAEILKYDGRPFSLDELLARLHEVLA
ncbi:MAG: 2-oxoacid:acceptor oxidoreductase subunit alpha [Methanomicrobiales archaeon]|nr:2-oxoacid:acceptor oxidoreductase subunit alpha [Methanomicrobiales archaeon]MDI6875250.1 2-oxoacid:acceptor oxidoreductase subunit alpha [Methanomicrobiales archaeon]